jgi:methyl-accepting chemotaxis protein PixJ
MAIQFHSDSAFNSQVQHQTASELNSSKVTANSETALRQSQSKSLFKKSQKPSSSYRLLVTPFLHEAASFGTLKKVGMRGLMAETVSVASLAGAGAVLLASAGQTHPVNEIEAKLAAKANDTRTNLLQKQTHSQAESARVVSVESRQVENFEVEFSSRIKRNLEQSVSFPDELASQAVLVQSSHLEGMVAQETPGISNTVLLRGAELLAIATAAAGVGVVLAAVLRKKISVPLKQLQQTTHRFLEGDRTIRADAFGDDEVGQLANTFNRLVEQVTASEVAMTQQIRRQTQELEQAQFFIEQARFFSTIAASETRTLQNLETLFQKAVQGARQILKADRVVVYRFSPDWSGYISAEAVDSKYPRAGGGRIEDACIGQELIEAYRKGRVIATHNVDEAGFHPDHLRLMEQLKVKANLVTPVLRDGELYGLLVAHHCEAPHVWQQPEVDFLQQLALQLGLAVDRVIFLMQKDGAILRNQQLSEITGAIANADSIGEIYQCAIAGVREALKTDRALVYLFNENWQGTVVAEAVGAGFPEALGANIADPCFADQYIDKYLAGRVKATNNIYEAGLSDCYLGQLEPFAVKANLVAPILAYDKLHGLLVTHQCSTARAWQEPEITFFKQVASQVGVALDRMNYLAQKDLALYRTQKLSEITSAISTAAHVGEVYKIATTGVRESLKTDRVVVYLFDEHWQGQIVAESVNRGFPRALGANIADPCFAEKYIGKYLAGRVQATANIYEAGLSDCYLGQLEPFEVKANLVAPILAYNRLHGLLVTHQCSAPRNWQEADLVFFKQVASQVGLALDRVGFLEELHRARQQAENLAREQRQQREELQESLIHLLSQVEAAAQGDLTIRAEVTTGEIGTVADFFNSIVESLRQIVTQVKRSTFEVSEAIAESEGSIRQLANSALQQAEEMSYTLNSVEQMTHSIRAVAESARQAAEVSDKASATAEAGGVAMDLTVRNILSLRDTIGSTAKKIKRLGEASQQISKVVSLIEKIALQTNLLAINAGIEAARAGKDGSGFAIVAEEVGELATQSARATGDIEEIVATIQAETNQVVEAMEQSTSQVVEGTHLVQDARMSLNQIVEVSHQINQLVKSISEATVSQTQTSLLITGLMRDVAQDSKQTSARSRQVSDSLQQTVTIAKALQISVEAFKISSESEVGEEITVPL